jgi:hypothetical protein
MKRLAVLVTAVGLVAASESTMALRTEAAPVARAIECGRYGVPAVIGGKRVCLREGQRCGARLDRQYSRASFRCLAGRLVVPWSALRRRALVEAPIAPGSPCPVTTVTGRVGPFAGLGPGPAYPIGESNVMSFRLPPPPEWGAEWGGMKRLWLLEPRYPGRALVRGRQLDGPNEIRFVYGRPGFTPSKLRNPVRELRLEGYSDYPALTRLRAPGCYAYQVDGRTFTYLVIFEAKLGE